MSITKKEKINHLLDIVLWLCGMGFALFIPFSGAVSDYIPKASVFSLGFAGLFSIVLLCKAVLQRRVIEYVRRDILMFLLFLATAIITTVKYGIDIFNNSQTTFFGYYAIPIYMAGAFSVGVWLRENRSRIYELMQAYSIMFCLLFLLFNDRYIMDLGGVVRAVGNYSNPNEMSVYAFCALCFSAILLWAKQYSTFLNLVLSAISLSALFLSQSRTSILAVILMLVMTGFVWILGVLHNKSSAKSMFRRLVSGRSMISIAVFALLTVLCFRLFSPNLLTVTDIRGEFYTYIGRVELIHAYPQLKEPLEALLLESEPPSKEEDYFANQEPEKDPPQDETPGQEPDQNSPQDPPAEEKPPQGITPQKPTINAFQSMIMRLVYGNGTDDSGVLSNLRFRIWLGYLFDVKDYWLWGAEMGFASVSPVIEGVSRACHNTFLYTFVQYGVIVAGLFISILLHLFKRLVFTFKSNEQKSPYAGALAGVCVFLLFNDLLYVAAFWLLLSVLRAACFNTNGPVSKKIAIVRRYSGFGGIEHQIENICDGLNAEGTDVHLLTDQVSDFSETVAKTGATIALIPLGNPLSTGIRLAKYCRDNHIDILQSHMFFESMACRVARALCGNLKHVYRVHTYIDCSHISKVKKCLYHAVAYLTDGFVDLYLPINDFNRQEMRKRSHLPATKIQIVHDGVSQPGEPYEHFSNEKDRIAMVANFAPFKGHDILVEGLDILRQRGIVMEAYLYGGCPRNGYGDEDTTVRDELQALVVKKGLQAQVHFCGYTNDVRQSLDGIWALVLPSYAEGTPNCILEAMSLKILTVCSDVGGVPEFLKDGITGYTHSPKDPTAFADVILHAKNASELQNKEIVERAYHVWQEEYSVPSMTNGLVACYETLLK